MATKTAGGADTRDIRRCLSGCRKMGSFMASTKPFHTSPRLAHPIAGREHDFLLMMLIPSVIPQNSDSLPVEDHGFYDNASESDDGSMDQEEELAALEQEMQDRKGKTLAAAFGQVMEKPRKGQDNTVPILAVRWAVIWSLGYALTIDDLPCIRGAVLTTHCLILHRRGESGQRTGRRRKRRHCS